MTNNTQIMCVILTIKFSLTYKLLVADLFYWYFCNSILHGFPAIPLHLPYY